MSCILDALPGRQCLFIYIAEFDVCASCYHNKGPSAVEIELHKMEHPVVKWTLSPRDGQREWVDLEANAVLEDLQTNVRVGGRTGDSDEEDDHDDDDEEQKEGNQEEQGEEDAGNQEDTGITDAWADVVAKLGLDVDETETGNQAKDEDHSVDGEEVVRVTQDPVTPPRSYTCGRCSEGIELDSTFYRCVGHSCRGAFMPQSSIF